MRLHTNIHTPGTLHLALEAAQAKGQVAPHVGFEVLTSCGSRKRARAYEIRFGTYTKVKGDKRTFWNSGTHGADKRMYSATYDEWGWFLAHMFAADPDAVTNRYDGETNFHEVTRHAYHVTPDVVTGYPNAKASTA